MIIMRLNWLSEHLDEVMVFIENQNELVAFSHLVDCDYNVYRMKDEDLICINDVMDRYMGE